MSGPNWVLTMLLCAQVLFFGTAYLVCGSEGSSRMAPDRLLEGLDRENIKRIRIRDEEDRFIGLTKREAGWVLDSAYDYPADPERTGKLVGDLTTLRSSYVVAGDRAHHVDLEVADKHFKRKVEVESEGLSRKLLVGGTAPGGMVHLRVDDDPTVYAVEGLKLWQLGTRVADWAEREYFKVDQGRLVSLQIRRGNQELNLDRAETGKWQLNRKPVEASKAENLLNAATRIELSEVVGKALEKADLLTDSKNPVTVTLGLAAEPRADAGRGSVDGGVVGGEAAEPKQTLEVVERRVLQFGDRLEKKSVVLLHLVGSDYLVEVDRWRVEELLDADPQKLLGSGG